MRSAAVVLASMVFCLAACESGAPPFGKDIFSQPVSSEGLESPLPGIEAQGKRGYQHPTFENSDGSVTRVLWLENGMGEKIKALLANHPDWKQIQVANVPNVFTDANIVTEAHLPGATPAAWGKATGAEGLTITGPIEAVDKATDLVSWLLKSPATIVIEARVVEVLEDDEFGFGIDWFLLDTGDQTFGQPIVPSKTVFDQGTIGRGVPPLPGFGTGGFIPSLVANLGTIQRDIQVDLLIQALKVFTKVDVVNTPNVAVQDGFSAVINAGQKVPYFQPQISAGISTITTVFEDVNVQLQVIPRLIPPSTIRLTVKTDVKNVSDVQTVTFEGVSITNPVIATRSVTTTLDVPDGSTVVLGGLITNTKIEVEEKVPFLGEIPILDIFFRNRHRDYRRNNLIFFIRPYVLGEGTLDSGEVIVPPQPGEMDREKKD